MTMFDVIGLSPYISIYHLTLHYTFLIPIQYIEIPDYTAEMNIYRNWDHFLFEYTLSEAWSGVNWADLVAAQGAFGNDS